MTCRDERQVYTMLRLTVVTPTQRTGQYLVLPKKTACLQQPCAAQSPDPSPPDKPVLAWLRKNEVSFSVQCSFLAEQADCEWR